MRKKTKILSCFAFLLLIVGLSLSGIGEAFIGGHFDDNQDYNCNGGSCHAGDGNRGAAEIDVELDKTSVVSGQSLIVTVNVTSVQLGGSSLIGVFLLTSQAGSNDQPSSQGWTIAQDPNGGTAADGSARNYVEKTSPGSGETVSFRWSLEAPSAPGSYNFFIRVHHGSVANNPLWEDYTGLVSVEVTQLPLGTPEIDFDPVSVGYIDEPVTIKASMVNATEAFVSWRYVGQTQFTPIELINTSIEDEFGYVFEGSIPPQSNETEIEYKIVANRETEGGPLVTETSVFTLSIEKRPEVPDFAAWTIQIIVFTEVVVFGFIISVRLTRAEKKEED